MSAPATYPVRLEARRDAQLSRWLWLVKWLLALPHYVILAFAWIAFVLLSVVAFFAILFTGRYPRPIFDFNVGVMRWTWRVQHYAYGALGTDRYPPFTLADVPDYPAHLDVTYPQHLSRGLVLVKWWLLALPHYLIVGLFLGGAALTVREDRAGLLPWVSGGLVGVLVLVAGVALAFTGRYPPPIYDFVLGMDRWAVRVAAYAGLMTDTYPPFRLDMGGPEPGAPERVRPEAPPAREQAPAGWTGRRVAAGLTGATLSLLALGPLAGSAGALWVDAQRGSDGYISAPGHYYEAAGSALTTARVEIHAPQHILTGIQDFTGTVRVRVSASDPDRETFVGIAKADDVDRYLAGVPYTSVEPDGDAVDHPGSTVPPPPAGAGIWAAGSTGTGTVEVRWEPANGDWVAVAMNADAAPGVNASMRVAATLPGLPWVAAGLAVLGALMLAAGLALLLVTLSHVRRDEQADTVAAPEGVRIP